MHDEIDFAKTGGRIQKSRKSRKLTQEEPAEKCGCSSNHRVKPVIKPSQVMVSGQKQNCL